MTTQTEIKSISMQSGELDKILKELALEYTIQELLEKVLDFFNPKTSFLVEEIFIRKLELGKYLTLNLPKKIINIQNEIHGTNNPKNPDNFQSKVQCINCYNYFDTVDELLFHRQMTNTGNCDYHNKYGTTCLEILLKNKEVLNDISVDQACERCDEICPSCLNQHWG